MPSPSSVGTGASTSPPRSVLRVRRRPVATLQYLFASLDKIAFENAIARWTAAAAPTHGWSTVSLDGKTLRGSTDVQLPGVHLLAAYAHEAGIVLCQLPVDAKTNEHKAALELLDLIPVKGKLVTGDAMW